jgi:hypothetical protein
VDAAVSIGRYAEDLVSHSSSSQQHRAGKLHQIALLSLFICVLRGVDYIGPSLGAAVILELPVVWMLVSVVIAVAALMLLRMICERMNQASGKVVLKYHVNAVVRVSALVQWLRRQRLIRVRVCYYYFK